MGIAAATSITECCLMNTVDILISMVAREKTMRQPRVLKCLLFQAAAETATEPMT